MVKGMMLVRHRECDAFVTAGSSGAVLAGGQILIGRVKGIERAPFAPVLPTAKGPVLLIDCGANVDARPSQLVQWAQMGSIYMENILGIKSPRVAIANVGAEEEKGNALVKETMPLLKALDNINFTGSVEARDIPFGAADVVVCDAFVGNMILKRCVYILRYVGIIGKGWHGPYKASAIFKYIYHWHALLIKLKAVVHLHPSGDTLVVALIEKYTVTLRSFRN